MLVATRSRICFVVILLFAFLRAEADNYVGKIDGEFAVTPMGQATYEIPIPALPSTGGMAPKLSITYNSSTKSSMLGYGFDLTGLSIISRVPQNIANDGRVGCVTFSDSDRFALDGSRLIETDSISPTKRIYFTECNSYARITSYGLKASPDSFVVQTKDGLTYKYLPNTKIVDPSSTTSGLFWMLTRAIDTKGNYFTVSYSGYNFYNEIYPTRIDYTGNVAAGLQPYASVRFSYEDRPDSAYTYIHGHIVRHLKCISSISLYSGNYKMREYQMGYTMSRYHKLLTSITETAANGTSKPPTTFQWHDAGSLTVSAQDIQTIQTIYKVDINVGDFNGDGKADFVATPYSSDAGYSGWQLFTSNGSTFANISSGTLQDGAIPRQVVVGDFNGDGKDDFAVLSKPNSYYYVYAYVSTGSGFLPPQYIYSSTSEFTIHSIEANGDGLKDLLIAFSNSKNYRIHLMSQYSNGNLFSYNVVTGSGSQKWGTLVCCDFNGDGLTDIANRRSSGSQAMIADGQGGFTETSLGYNTEHELLFGDFNGDGKTDYLVTAYQGTDFTYWMLFSSIGTGSFWEGDISPPFLTTTKHVTVADVNNDGFDDLYTVNLTGGSSPQVYLNDCTGRFHAQPTGASSYAIDQWHYYFGDFNGDGKTEFLCTSNWAQPGYWRGVKLFKQPAVANLLLASVTDGMGNTTQIEYKYMSDSSVHVRGTTRDNTINSFSAPWPVVWQVKTPDGIGGLHTTTYSYENALVHRLGRGVLGFSKVKVTDSATGIITTTEYTPSLNKYIMEPRHTESKLGYRLLSEKDVEFNFAYPSETVFSHLPTSVTEKTYEYSSGSLVSEVQTTYSYDSYGNATQVSTVNGDVTVSTANTYTNDETRWLLGRLTSSTVTKSSTAGTKIRRATFQYDNVSGLLTRETSEPGDPDFGHIKTYVRDAFGNITKSTVTPLNAAFQPRSDSTSYDTKGRYLVSQTNALGHTVTHYIDQDNGLPFSTTDANGINTSYTYDPFGRLRNTSTPIATTSSTIGWSTGMTDAPAHALYYVRTEATGQPYVLEFFDCLGRSIRRVTENADGQKIYADAVYNAKGQLLKTSEPYFPDSTVLWNINTYDAVDRPIRQADAAGHATTYAYSSLTTTTTDALGHHTVRTVDSHGNLIQSTDNEGGTVTYEYDVDGHCTRLVGPRTTVTMQYDLVGNRTRLVDPDIGTVISVYNAYGELMSQTDSKGTTTYQYDRLGRIVTETRPDMTVTSVYDTGFIGALTSITASNGTSTQYTYDSYGRVVQQQQTVSERTFTLSTSYNAQGLPSLLTYPNGLQVRNNYSSNGILTSVINASTQDSFWHLGTQNARGQATQVTYGNGVVSTFGYDTAHGRLTSAVAPGISSWSYGYDAVGNLSARTDNTRNLAETFTYDSLDRLTGVSRNGQQTHLVTYDAAGNITAKSGVGHDFVYEEGSNRLLSYYADGSLPRQWDGIQYNSFHKVSRIDQGSANLQIVYGPEKSRRYSITYKGNAAVEEKYYAGNLYEEVWKLNDGTRQICYIYAGDKAVAIHETKGNQTPTLLYLHHDHIGTIQAYSDAGGQLLQELSYDPWGRRRDPVTWEYYDHIADANARNPWGFTGHEHLDLFEMVNMDGRMYDPVLGRFLSPDPFVQAPDFTQGLNRYAYCLNNPLSLTDPTGYSWLSHNWKALVASAVGITVGALSAGIASGVTGAIIAGALGGASSALTGSLLNGANIGQVAKSTLTGAFWGGVSGFLNYGSYDEQLLLKIFKHSLSEGWLEGVQGGNMFHGFLLGAVSSAGNHYIDKYGKTLGRAGKIASAAVLGGTVSEIGGGKFANGAITGAYGMMFNEMMHGDHGATSRWDDDNEYTPHYIRRGGTYYSVNKDGSLSIAGEVPLESVYPEIFVTRVGGNLLKTLSKALTFIIGPSIRFSNHGYIRSIERGFTTRDIDKIIRNGIRTEKVGRYGNQYLYEYKHNTVIVDKKTGKVITAFSDRKNNPGVPDGFIYK